jgi:hypothetical protein
VTWGAIISEPLAVQAADGLLGIHVNMPGTVPPDVLRHHRNFDRAPADAISCYWVTNTATSSPGRTGKARRPVAVRSTRSISGRGHGVPGRFTASRTWAKKSIGNLIYWNEGPAGSGRRRASTGICVP